MADVVITMRIMPSSVEVDLDGLHKEVLAKIVGFAGVDNSKMELVPVAFGLKALQIMFVMPEAKGATDALEADIAEMEQVESVEITDVRRTIG